MPGAQNVRRALKAYSVLFWDGYIASFSAAGTHGAGASGVKHFRPLLCFHVRTVQVPFPSSLFPQTILFLGLGTYPNLGPLAPFSLFFTLVPSLHINFCFPGLFMQSWSSSQTSKLGFNPLQPVFSPKLLSSLPFVDLALLSGLSEACFILLDAARATLVKVLRALQG